MLSKYNPIDIELFLRSAPFHPPFPPASNRAEWEAAREKLGKEQVAHFIQKAEKALVDPITFLPASLYLECKRTGERKTYENEQHKRSEMLRDLVIGECLDYQGRYLDKIMDAVWAICEESSWVLPAHQFDLADMENPYVDLGAAGTALELAEVDALVGAELDPLVGKRIRHEINRRCFIPYLTRHDFWWLYDTQLKKVNNWTAVCNAGIMGAAIYLEEDPARLAAILYKGLRSLDDYLATFDEDGGSSEGPGYWTYGFSYYTIIAHLIEHRTAGKVRMLDGEFMQKIVQFPLRAMLCQGMFANFSDAHLHATFISAQLAYLARRCNVPGLIDLAKEQPPFTARPELAWLVRSMIWDLPQPDGTRFVPAAHDWYNGMMWMFSRYNPADPDALVLAAKGGHNDEMHNHNDVGSFIVHTRQESVIADLGSGRYTRQYFGPERYEHFTTASIGHSVPLVNGQEQHPGEEFAAQLLEHTHAQDCDVLHLELKDAYPDSAGISSLRRRLVMHREGPSGWVELADTFAFRDAPGMFESALTTFGKVEIGESALVIEGDYGKLRVGFDPEVVYARAELYKDVALAEGPRSVYRIAFTLLEPQKEGTVRLEIVPV